MSASPNASRTPTDSIVSLKNRQTGPLRMHRTPQGYLSIVSLSFTDITLAEKRHRKQRSTTRNTEICFPLLFSMIASHPCKNHSFVDTQTKGGVPPNTTHTRTTRERPFSFQSSTLRYLDLQWLQVNVEVCARSRIQEGRDDQAVTWYVPVEFYGRGYVCGELPKTGIRLRIIQVRRTGNTQPTMIPPLNVVWH